MQRLAAEAEGVDGDAAVVRERAQLRRRVPLADERELGRRDPTAVVSHRDRERADVERHDHLGRARVEGVVHELERRLRRRGDGLRGADRVGDVAGERLNGRGQRHASKKVAV